MIKRVLVLWFCLFSFLDADTNRTIALDSLLKTDLTIKDKTFKVWLAIDPKQKKEGLSFLTADEVPVDHGMLFLYAYEEKLSFWMKDTFFDLDIAYIKSDSTVVDIYSMTKMSSKTFTSSSKARYVLELRAGEFEKMGLNVGDKVEFSSMIEDLAKL